MTDLSFGQLGEFLDKYPSQDIADIGGGSASEQQLDFVRVYDLPEYDVCEMAMPRQHQTIICMDTFEHIYDPVRAAEHIVGGLKPEGRLFLTTVFNFQKHARHGYPDTYRYTDDALRWLFRDLDIIECWFSDEGYVEEWGPRIRISLTAQKPPQ